VNHTTNTFNISAEKWLLYWRPGEPNPNDECFVEIYNASTDEKLGELTLATDWEHSYVRSEELHIRGSFYLMIQVNIRSGNWEIWHIRIFEYNPQLDSCMVLGWIVVIGIASVAVICVYQTYEVMRA
jgi:hypothetical protein